MCFGAPITSTPPPPPPPQLPQTPSTAAVRSSTAQAAPSLTGETLLTGGTGDPLNPASLGKKTLLGQ